MKEAYILAVATLITFALATALLSVNPQDAPGREAGRQPDASQDAQITDDDRSSTNESVDSTRQEANNSASIAGNETANKTGQNSSARFNRFEITASYDDGNIVVDGIPGDVEAQVVVATESKDIVEETTVDGRPGEVTIPFDDRTGSFIVGVTVDHEDGQYNTVSQPFSVDP